ncbi:unnamed protein product [Paramecium octaurelia]|uniref:Uncharacterized protein n=1 Tax=Paramecium octaurelia TaxID=43137 RepID=A0A8S1X2D0_PAROT|nr:unnamed protein product [Paramecium octaurelia]
MLQFDIEVINGKMLQLYQDNQGIKFNSQLHRSSIRDTYFQQNNNQDIPKYRGANSNYYQFAKFHQTKGNEITHYQLRKCLVYNQYSNQLIHCNYNKLCFYNPCSYKQHIQIIEDNFNSVSISQCDDQILLAGLNSNILFFSLRNGQRSEYKLAENGECIINQADFINNHEIIVSDNDNQIRIFDPENLNQEKYLATCSHCVNHCAIQNHLIIACLDKPQIHGFDRRDSRSSLTLKGHVSNNFVARFDPTNEMKVATSGEDKKCLIWDLRNYQVPFDQVDAISKTFYNILYNNQGQLICIESNDFVQIVNLENSKLYQVIDFFGQCGGCTIYKDKMYFNLQSHRKMGLFEYNLINNNNF